MLKRAAPEVHGKLARKLTMPASSHLVSTHGIAGGVREGAQPVHYFTFNVKVRKNSMFGQLSEDDYEELGGVEFRALSALLWLVPLVSPHPLQRG